MHRGSLRLDARAVHVFVPAVDPLPKLTTCDVFGTCADVDGCVPVEVRHLTADRELGQRLGTVGHDMFQANEGVSGGADGKMEHSFLEELAFRDRHALSLVTGETDRHAQRKRSQRHSPCSCTIL